MMYQFPISSHTKEDENRLKLFVSFVKIVLLFRNWTFLPVAEIVSEEFRSRSLVFVYSPQKITMNLSESLSYHSIGKLKQS